MKYVIISAAVSVLSGCAAVTPQRAVEIYNTGQNLAKITEHSVQAELLGRLHRAR